MNETEKHRKKLKVSKNIVCTSKNTFKSLPPEDMKKIRTWHIHDFKNFEQPSKLVFIDRFVERYTHLGLE